SAEKFYYLPFRFFEISFGGIIALYMPKLFKIKLLSLLWIFWIGILVLCCVSAIKLDNTYKVLFTTILCGGILVSSERLYALNNQRQSKLYGLLAIIGIASYSIYIWHQVFFAFYKYIFNSQ